MKIRTMSAKSVAHHWKPIEDLPNEYTTLAQPELRALEKVWKDQRDQLEKLGLTSRFLERFRRQWAIETGIVERLYSLDRGVTETLIEQGIDASLIPRDERTNPERVASMIRDHAEVFDGMFVFVKSERPLSTSYIKELHAVLTRSQEEFEVVDTLGRSRMQRLVHGAYKQLPNSPTRGDGSVHQYCPPEHTEAEMERLIQMHLEHSKRRVPPEIAAAWLHHAFTQIHPFQDGNGRVARTLASLVFIKANWFPLSIDRDDQRYIASLEEADRGQLGPLVELFAAVQENTFVQALSIAGEVQRVRGEDQLIAAVKSQLEKRETDLNQQWDKGKRLAHGLWQMAARRFEVLELKLTEQLASNESVRFRVDTEEDDGQRRHYFREQVVAAARELNYWANIGVFHEWVRLTLRTGEQAEILLSFHGIGHEYRGLIAASLMFFRRQEADEGVRQVTPASTVSDRIFQVNYKETKSQAQTRFQTWLDEGLVRGLAMWQKGL